MHQRARLAIITSVSAVSRGVGRGFAPPGADAWYADFLLLEAAFLFGMTKQEGRKMVQEGGYVPFRSAHGGEMYISKDKSGVVCFHSYLHRPKPVEFPDLFQCIDCGDCSSKREQFPYSFTSYAEGYTEPVENPSKIYIATF